MHTADKNYYEVLEVNTTVSPDDLYKGYQRAKNAYSNDSLALYSLMSQDECDQILNLIEDAYGILSDPEKRKQYDAAKGINSDMSDNQRRGFVHSDSEDEKAEFMKDQNTTRSDSMTKIVAKQKFSLEYLQNDELELEIEQCTEFTGQFLQKIREYKNVDINRMSEMTKVSKTYLKNIEAEEYDKLPATVYVRGFVYQYAKCLKLNPEMVANSFLTRLKSLKGDN